MKRPKKIYNKSSFGSLTIFTLLLLISLLVETVSSKYFILISNRLDLGANFVQINTQPNIIQTKNAKLIIGFSVKNAVNSGGYLLVTFPKSM